MREIVLDTETTGLDPSTGDRVVEIGALELVNHLPSGNTYHQYINPGRPMPAEAFAIHGLTEEFLRDKPVFRAIAPAFLAFVGDAPLVIHNATFDMRFLSHELREAGFEPIPASRAIDTLTLARRKYPGALASLDALCRRFGIDNSHRDKHGALLDSELLAEVYLELIGGRQPGFALAPDGARDRAVHTVADAPGPHKRPEPLSPRLTPYEAARHAALVEELGENALWRRFVKP